MPANPQNRWDIFCTVIDNYGDIGVCWRLARQLVAEHGLSVRLWVDDLPAFQRICPEIAPLQPVQCLQGVDVRNWPKDFPETTSADVVIEAFACHLPENYVAAMAARNPTPVWVNLEYLSAENWVSGCHALPSPHPRLPLEKYFFFPGFDETTGGLLREQRLEASRQEFIDSPEQQSEFWLSLGMAAPDSDALLVSLFAYANDALPGLLECWAQGSGDVCALVPVTRTLPALEAFAGRPMKAGDIVQRGQLEIRLLPFVEQADYDRLVWLCDINFVRGEDSFVRAQWAGKPLVWHIYPQDEAAHLAKLAAFLGRYCAGLPEAVAGTVRGMFMAWNGGSTPPALWAQWVEVMPVLRQHAANWSIHLKKQDDLCSNLVRFCRSKL